MMEKVVFQDLGLIDYKEAWDYQQVILKKTIDNKLKNRKLEQDDPARIESPHHLLFCEHPPVFTLGRSGKIDHLLMDEASREENGVQFYKINRGGDITFHGPGQLIGYPIFDLDRFFTDIHKYVRYLEEAVIRLLDHYGLQAERLEGFTGVWLPAKGEKPPRKICAIGVHLSRWVTMHGFALNVNTDLKYFKGIVPCGIDAQEKAVTSMAQELGHPLDFARVKMELKTHFSHLFEFEIIQNNEEGHSTT
ncbi:MAG: lipoyl(octanoyl) transferase LipB [Bacteroidota bacterium]